MAGELRVKNLIIEDLIGQGGVTVDSNGKFIGGSPGGFPSKATSTEMIELPSPNNDDYVTPSLIDESFNIRDGRYSVKRYGARGDNLTDDTLAIQTAIDTAVANGGGVVWFPEGVYRITALSWTGNNVGLSGVGSSSILRMMSPTGDTITIGSTSINTFKPFITGLHFAPGVVRTSGREINAIYTTLLTIDDVMFSSVNVAIRAGHSLNDSVWGKIGRLQAFEYSKLIHLIRTVDFQITAVTGQAQNNLATSFHLDGGNDGTIVTDMGLVNGLPDADINNQGSALLIQMVDYTGRPPRYCKFNGCYFDTHKIGVDAHDGYGIDFISFFGSNRPGSTVVLRGNTKWFTFNGGSSVSSGLYGFIIDGLGHTINGVNILSGGFSAPDQAGILLKSTSKLTRIINCSIGNSDDGFFAGNLRYGVEIEAGCDSYIIDAISFLSLSGVSVVGHAPSANRVYDPARSITTGGSTVLISAEFSTNGVLETYVPEIGNWTTFDTTGLTISGGTLNFNGLVAGEFGGKITTTANTRTVITVESLAVGGVILTDIRRIGSTFVRFQIERLDTTTVRFLINQFVAGTPTGLISGLGYIDYNVTGSFTVTVIANASILTAQINSNTPVAVNTSVVQSGEQYLFQYGTVNGQGAGINSYLLETLT